MKKIVNWFKLTWRRLKSKTPKYFFTWAFIMAVLGTYLTFVEQDKADPFFPEAIRPALYLAYDWIKFITRLVGVGIPLLTTVNTVLSKATPKNYEAVKPEIKAAEAEIRKPQEPPIEDQKNEILGSSRFEP
jgi:hypothetical protein